MERSQCTISERSKLRIVYMIFFVWEERETEAEAEDCVCKNYTIEFLFWEMENEDLVWHESCMWNWF